MKQLLKTATVCLATSLAVISCKKDAGPGGLATIKGKVYGVDVTTGGNVKDSGYVGSQRVFISVAGNTAHFDDVRTSYDGTYQFQFLRKGSYDVWTYSDCDTCRWAQQLVMKAGIEISDKKETVEVEDLRIIF